MYPDLVRPDYISRAEINAMITRIGVLEQRVAELTLAQNGGGDVDGARAGGPLSAAIEKRTAAAEDAIASLRGQVSVLSGAMQKWAPTLANTVTNVHTSMSVVTKAWQEALAALYKFMHPIAVGFSLEHDDEQHSPPIGPRPATETEAAAAAAAAAAVEAAPEMVCPQQDALQFSPTTLFCD